MKIIHWLPAFLVIAYSPAMLTAASPRDHAIERAALASYTFGSVLEARVQISVQDGIATLTGTAHDRDLRSLASDTVAGLPDVRAVNNRMIVETSILEYSDAWIALKLRNCLLMRAGIDAARISAEVTHQVATLTGSVESLEQKQLAEKYARAVNWVRSVSNDLTVDAVAPATPAAGVPVDDASISAMLKYSLRGERLITLSRTNVTTRGGTVLIDGHAESEAEKTLISTCAMSIRGVISVRNNMLVKTSDSPQPPYAMR